MARTLREDHNLAQRNAGRSAWAAPRIQTLHQWLRETWAGTWPSGQLLHPVQELALWRQAIEEDETQAVLAPLAAARQARHAEQLALQYGIDLSQAGAWREEHHAFHRWQAAVQKRRGREGWLTDAELPRETAALIRQKRIDLPPAVRLAGFLDALPAGERVVLEALSAAGVEVEFLPFEPAARPAVRREFHRDAESQFRAIGAAIRARLLEVPRTSDPEQGPPRIVVAMPDPEVRRELIENLFRPLLAPWLLTGGADAVPWRWERGRPLAEQPWIDAALAVCEFAAADTAPEVVSRMLLSSALWDDAERLLTARLDYALRDSGVPRLRSGRLLEACPEPLRERLTAFTRLLDTEPRQALPSAWAGFWQARLQALGWPGRSALDSAAFQVVSAWTQLLAQLSSMDAQLGPLPARAALGWLGELARSTPYSPRVEYLQPIVLLRLDEAAGLNCDQLFLADLSSDRFPGRASASPYLPLDAQAAAQVPGATPRLQLEQAQRLAAHLLQQASEVCLTAPRVDERGAELKPAPAFGDGRWPETEVPAAVCQQEQDSSQPPRLIWPAQDPAPPVSPPELAGIHADARLFQLWFASPFFAFCRYRLGIEALPAPGFGLQSSDQGVVLHRVLEDLWGGFGDSRALAALDDAALQQCVNAALLKHLPRRMPPADYGAAQLRLEHARMTDLLMQWLRLEKCRPEPFTVVLRESPIKTAIAGLPLELRMDRVDRVQTADGPRWLIMDYKTGREAKRKDWDAEKLLEPQLPLYASHADVPGSGMPQVDGIAYGHLRDGHPALVWQGNWDAGLSDAKTGMLDAQWSATLAAWRSVLEAAAAGFLSGQASFDPDGAYRGAAAEFLALTGKGTREDLA